MTNIKKLLQCVDLRLFLCVVFISVLAISLLTANFFPAQTFAQSQRGPVDKAEEWANDQCDVIDPGDHADFFEACVKRYKAAYLGDSNYPDCPDAGGDESKEIAREWCVNGVINGSAGTGARDARNSDYPNISKVCESFINNSNRGNWPKFADLSNREKDEAIRACNQGMTSGLVYSPGDYPSSASCTGSNVLRQACLAGRALADNYIFEASVARNVARNGTLRSTSASPGTGDPSNPDAAGDGELDTETCDGMGPLAWIVCPIVDATLGTINTLDNLINDLLTVNTRAIFNTNPNSDGSQSSGARYKEAWNAFRAIALGLIAIAALIVIIATAFGLEIFDAYTIRKVLPRFLIAIIFITLSWSVMNFLIQLSNDVGNGVRALIYLPFDDMVVNFNAASGIFSWVVLGGAVAATGFSLIGFLSLALTGLLAVLIAFLVLIVRELIIIMLVLVAPIAIACLILPNTRKMWQLWQNTFTAMLIVFPIISAMIATGRVFAATITNNDSAGAPGDIVNNIIAFIAYILPYFLLPFAFRAAGGLMATLAGIGNDRSKGMFDRLSNFRENKRQKRYQDAIQGKNTKGIMRPVGHLARRAHLADQGGLSVLPSGRARYHAARQGLLNQTTAEMLKNDDGRAANDDEGTALAIQKGMTRNRYIQEYATKMKKMGFSDSEARKRALDSLGTMEASFGARIGTEASRAAAFRARAMSSTAYGVDALNPDATYQQMFSEAADMVNSGLMTEADAVSAFKQNKSRADISGFSFMDGIKQVQATRESGTVTRDQAKKLRQSALAGSRPGEVLSGRHETVTALAPEMTAQLDAAVKSGDQTDIMRELAALAGKYDAMASISPKNAEIMANNVLGQTLVDAGKNPAFQLKDKDGNPTGKTMTIRQMIESNRSNDQFLNMRREYSAREEQMAAAAAQQQLGGQTDPNQV